MKLTDLLVMAAGAAILVITVFQSVSGQETCGDIGGVREQRMPRDASNFYINLAAPAACSGYVNSFSFCYYRPLGDIQYVFTFALYRESNISEGTYNSVSRTFVVERTLSDIQSESEGRSFICVNLPVSEAVPVEAGDMLGACVYNDSDTGVVQLDIVSRVSTGDGNLLRDVASVCSPNTVPSTTIATDRAGSRFLNLNAEIVPPTEPPSTMGTTTVIETTPIITDTTTMNVPLTMTTTTIVTVPATVETETTPLDTKTTTVNGLSTTVSMETTQSSTNTTGAPVGDGNGDGGAVFAAVIVVLIILVVSAVIVVLVVLLVKKQKPTKRHYSVQTTGGIQDGIVISDGPDAELESNTAYGVSRDMNSRQFEEATCFETIDRDNPANTTLTNKSAEPAVELESNTAYGVSRFGEAFYETIDSDNPANPTLTRAFPAGGVVTNLQDNEAYGASSGVSQSEQETDDNEYWNVTGQDDCNEYDYVNQL